MPKNSFYGIGLSIGGKLFKCRWQISSTTRERERVFQENNWISFICSLDSFKFRICSLSSKYLIFGLTSVCFYNSYTYTILHKLLYTPILHIFLSYTHRLPLLYLPEKNVPNEKEISNRKKKQIDDDESLINIVHFAEQAGLKVEKEIIPFC